MSSSAPRDEEFEFVVQQHYQGLYRFALLLTASDAEARDLAQRVLRQLGPAPDADSVSTQIEHFDEQVSRVADQVIESGDQDALRLLGRARDMRDQAQDALNNGNLERSLRQIRTALNMLRQAAERTR